MPKPRNEQYKLACDYRDATLSVIPIARNGSKRPDSRRLPREWDETECRNKPTWKPFQERLASDAELLSWYSDREPSGIAIVCGAVSGNLIVIDIDDASLFEPWRDALATECPGLMKRLTVIETPRPGFQIPCRVPDLIEIPHNTVLAKNEQGKTLIEVRAEGGYIVTVGSPADCHPAKREYRLHSGPTLTTMNIISPDELEVLLAYARSFNRHAEDESNGAAEYRPGDLYNQRVTWDDVLTPHGWQRDRHSGEVIYWRRPGKDAPGHSATTGCCRTPRRGDLLYVFTSNAPPFEAGKSYSRFEAYTVLNHNGDYKVAAAALARCGFGDAPKGNRSQQDAMPPKWEPPLPLTEQPILPPFPLANLPPCVSRWASAEATATQTPPDLAAMLAMVTCSAGLAGKVRVEVRSGWTEPVNLYAAVALFSGERKSVVFRAALAPVYDREAALRAEMTPIIAAAKAEHAMLEAREKHLAAKAAKTEDKLERDVLLHNAKQASCELAKHIVPEEPELICDDVTPEKLTQSLHRQGGRLFQAAPEGTAFEICKGRYSESPNFDVYLKGHAGDPLRTGRVSRAREAIDSPALSVALAVQPDVIRGLASEATLRTRGFLARFLYSIPDSLVGRRATAPPPVAEPIAAEYRRCITELWSLAGSVDDAGKPAPHILEFATTADEVMRDFERWLEPLLAPGEDLSLLAGWAHKLAGAIARIAGVCHVAAAISEGRNWLTRIERPTVEAAIVLGRDYLLPHAKAAFGLMGADERIEKAKRVWDSLTKRSEYSECSESAPLRVTRREIHQRNRRQFAAAKDLEPIIQVLIDRGYLYAIPASGEAGRGHSSPVYLVNPLAIRIA